MEKSAAKKNSKKFSLSPENIKNFLTDNKRTVLTGLALLANYFLFITQYTDLSKESQKLLLLSYKHVGFGARTFLGSVLSILGFSSKPVAAGVISADIFLFVVYFAICALFFALIITGLRGSKNSVRAGRENGTEIIAELLCVCPFFLYVFSYEFFGSVSSFLLVLLLVCVLMIRSPKMMYAVPFICAVGIFTDNVFAVVFLPVILFLLWYKSKRPKGKPYGKVFAVTVLTAVPLFIVMIPLSFKKNFTNVCYGDVNDMLYAEDFKFIQDLLQIARSAKQTGYNEALRFAFVLPLIIFLAVLWSRCIKISKKSEKTVSVLSFAHLFIILVPLIFFKGFSSWIAAVMSSQLALVIGFASEKNSAVCSVLKEFNSFFEKRKLWFFAAAALFYITVSEVLPLLLVPVW